MPPSKNSLSFGGFGNRCVAMPSLSWGDSLDRTVIQKAWIVRSRRNDTFLKKHKQENLAEEPTAVEKAGAGGVP